jgi:hypothetical protein
MQKEGKKLDLRDFVDLRPIVAEASARGECHIKLPCGKYLLGGNLSYLLGVTVEMLPPPSAAH